MIRVVGLGNEWTGDDAAGLKVAEALLPYKTASFDVQVLGVPEFHMFEGLNENDVLIVVDACQGSGEAGRVSKLPLDALPEDLMRHGSSHGLGLQHWLSMKQELDGISCQVLIYAIELEQITMGAPLSPAVATAVEKLVAQLSRQYAEPDVEQGAVYA